MITEEIRPVVVMPLEEAEALAAVLTVARAELNGKESIKKAVQEKQQLLRYRIRKCHQYYGLKHDGTVPQ